MPSERSELGCPDLGTLSEEAAKPHLLPRVPRRETEALGGLAECSPRKGLKGTGSSHVSSVHQSLTRPCN